MPCGRHGPQPDSSVNAIQPPRSASLTRCVRHAAAPGVDAGAHRHGRVRAETGHPASDVEQRISERRAHAPRTTRSGASIEWNGPDRMRFALPRERRVRNTGSSAPTTRIAVALDTTQQRLERIGHDPLHQQLAGHASLRLAAARPEPVPTREQGLDAVSRRLALGCARLPGWLRHQRRAGQRPLRHAPRR